MSSTGAHRARSDLSARSRNRYREMWSQYRSLWDGEDVQNLMDDVRSDLEDEFGPVDDRIDFPVDLYSDDTRTVHFPGDLPESLTRTIPGTWKRAQACAAMNLERARKEEQASQRRREKREESWAEAMNYLEERAVQAGVDPVTIPAILAHTHDYLSRLPGETSKEVHSHLTWMFAGRACSLDFLNIVLGRVFVPRDLGGETVWYRP